MAGEKDGEGAGNPDGGNGGGEGGRPAGTPPAGDAGTPPAGGSQPAGISLEILPEELRGLPEKQIKYLLDTTFSSVKTQNQRIRELQDRLDATPKGGSRPEDMAPEEGGASKSKGPPVDKNGKPKAMEDWILEEPEAALDYYLEKRFGSAVNKLNELDSRVGDSDFDAVKRQFEDFEEHEEDVKAILKDSGAAKTRDNILGAYTMVVGRKALADRDRNRRAAHNSESPPPDDPGTGLKKEYNKTPLTEEVRIASGLSEEEYYEKFSPTAPLQIKLPGEK